MLNGSNWETLIQLLNIIKMGKGDKKTKRGKLFQGSYGVRRLKKSAKPVSTAAPLGNKPKEVKEIREEKEVKEIKEVIEAKAVRQIKEVIEVKAVKEVKKDPKEVKEAKAVKESAPVKNAKAVSTTKKEHKPKKQESE